MISQQFVRAVPDRAFCRRQIRRLDGNFNGPHIECKLLVQVVLRDTCAIAALVRSEGRLRACRTGGDSIGRAFFVLRERLREIVRNDARPGLRGAPLARPYSQAGFV